MRIHATDCAVKALRAAKHLEHDRPPTEALVVSLLSQRGTAAERLLAQCDLAPQDVLRQFESPRTMRSISRNEDDDFWRSAIAAALEEARRYGPEKAWMDTAHLLIGLAEQRESLTAMALLSAGVDIETIRDASRQTLTVHALALPSPPGRWESLATSLGLAPIRRPTELLSTVGGTGPSM